MNQRMFLFVTTLIAVALFSTLQAQQLTLKASGNGKLTDSDGATYAASFEMWTDDASTAFINISAPAVAQNGMRITLSGFSADGTTAKGTITPCEGGVCPCSLQVNDAQSTLSGSCTNPEGETLRLNFSGFRRL
jgi:hypothetical protein